MRCEKHIFVGRCLAGQHSDNIAGLCRADRLRETAANCQIAHIDRCETRLFSTALHFAEVQASFREQGAGRFCADPGLKQRPVGPAIAAHKIGLRARP